MLTKICLASPPPPPPSLLNLQAFVQTASKIYDNIQSGVCDVSNEAHGIKVGVSASNGARYLAGEQNGKKADGGCC